MLKKSGKEAHPASGIKNSTEEAEIFLQCLNKHGTDFSYIKSNPKFQDFSDEQLFKMYEEYVDRKSTLVNKIGEESKIIKIEKIVGRSMKSSDEESGPMPSATAWSYKAQVLVEGKKKIQMVVDLQMDDFRLPFLLKDLELRLRQQLSYIEEIYSTLKELRAISPEFLEDGMYFENNSENSQNKADVAPGKSVANAPSSVQELAPKTATASKDHDTMDNSTPSTSGQGTPDQVAGGHKVSSIAEKQVDFKGSSLHSNCHEKTAANSEVQPNDHSCNEDKSTNLDATKPAEECQPNLSIALKANILNNYDDYLGDFQEDLLAMQPPSKTSTYNPLAPQVKRSRTSHSGTAASDGIGKQLDNPVQNATKDCAGTTKQNIQSMKKRNQRRVVMQSKLVGNRTASTTNENKMAPDAISNKDKPTQDNVAGSAICRSNDVDATFSSALCLPNNQETSYACEAKEDQEIPKPEEENLIALYLNKSRF